MESNTLLAFLKKASEDEDLRNELVTLAGRYGVQLGSDELNEAALEQVAGGLLPAVDLSTPKLETSLLRKESYLAYDIGKRTIGGTFKLGDGSV